MFSFLKRFDFGTPRELRQAVREMKQMEQQEIWALEKSEASPLNQALTALRAGDRAAAQALFEEALRRYPTYVRDAPETPSLLLDLKIYDRAEKLIGQWMREKPRSSALAEAWANIPLRQHDWPEALTRTRKIQRQFPGRFGPYLGEVEALRWLGRLDEATKAARSTLQKFEENKHALPVRFELARIAEARKDWPAAEEVWREVYDRYKHFAGIGGMARAMEEQGRIDEAEEMLLEFRKHYPGQIDILVGLARIAERQGDFDKTAARWADVRTKFPREVHGYFEGQRFLEEAKRPREEIEAIVTQAIHNFPQDSWPLSRFAWVAQRAQDWEEAAVRWQRLREKFPDNAEAYERGADALRRAGRAADADAVLAELAARRQE